MATRTTTTTTVVTTTSRDPARSWANVVTETTVVTVLSEEVPTGLWPPSDTAVAARYAAEEGEC